MTILNMSNNSNMKKDNASVIRI